MRGTDRVVARPNRCGTSTSAQVHADPAKVDVIYNAVDLAQAQTTTAAPSCARHSICRPSARVAGIIARLTEQKGHRFLFEALAANAALAELQLLIVGDGELRDASLAQASRQSLAHRVQFLGARRDLGDILAAIDMFVLPSLWEGLPLSLVLAMGAGVPVVATTRRRHSRSGRRWPNRLAGAARRRRRARRRAGARRWRIRDRARASRQRRRAAVLPRFSVDGYVGAVAALYDRLLRRTPSRRLTHASGHRLSHAVLARRRRRAARGRGIVRALRRFARAVFRRDRALRAGAARAGAAKGRAVRAAERDAGAAAIFRRPGAVLSAAAAMVLPLLRFVRSIDVLHCRVPTPGRDFRVRVRAAASRRPAFLLVVGDLRCAAADDAVSRRARSGCGAPIPASKNGRFSGWPIASLTFANGAALAREALAQRPSVHRDADDDDRRARHREPPRHVQRRRDSIVDREPHRSAQGAARAARGGSRAARRRAVIDVTLDIVGADRRSAWRSRARGDRRRGGASTASPTA